MNLMIQFLNFCNMFSSSANFLFLFFYLLIVNDILCNTFLLDFFDNLQTSILASIFASLQSFHRTEAEWFLLKPRPSKSALSAKPSTDTPLPQKNTSSWTMDST